MAYLVSQIRKDAGTTYMSTISSEPSTIESPNTFGGTNTYIDFALASTFTPDNVYYLRFKVHKIPKYWYSGTYLSLVSNYVNDADILNLQILLKNDNDDETENPPEIIGNCKVYTDENSSSTAYNSYSFVFSPSKVFYKLGFRINRTSFDAIYNTSTATYRSWLLDSSTYESGYRYTPSSSSIFELVVGNHIIYSNEDPDADLCTLNNLVSASSKTSWLKFGYQCRPGSLIVVNKLPIRIGRSGIYEINNGTAINSFMIASPKGSKNENIDAFLLDYAYKG